MRLSITALICFLSVSLHAQSILFVYATGLNNGSAYTRVELNGINIGTIGVNEHLITDLEPGLNKITFNRRGYDQFLHNLINVDGDHFIKINVGEKKWRINECSINEMPGYASSVIETHRSKNSDKSVVLHNHSDGVLPESGSAILTLINSEADCEFINPDVISNYINAVFLSDYRIVNRNKLSVILDEQKLSLSGLISIDESIEAGNLVGAKFSLIVSYQCLRDSEKIILTLNLINCETSQIEWVGILNKIKPSEILYELPKIID
jgi:hypothetical protein